MNEERVTYVELKLKKPNKPRDKRRSTPQKKGFPWHIISLCLGILCILLLLTTLFFGYMSIQKSYRCKSETGPEENATSSQEVKVPSVSPTTTERKQQMTGTCHEEWSCCRKMCYYFSTEEKTWEESKKACEDRAANLIKIDDKKEQVLIQSKLNYNYWVGFSRKGANKPWLWLDDSPLSKQLVYQPPKSNEEKCGYIKSSLLSTFHCNKPFFYICEKNLSLY